MSVNRIMMIGVAAERFLVHREILKGMVKVQINEYKVNAGSAERRKN